MFEARRGRLMQTMRRGVAVFAAGHEQIRNGDVHYELIAEAVGMQPSATPG